MHPILFQLGPIIIYSFSLFLATGLFFGAFIVWKFGRNEFSEDRLFDGIFISFLTALAIGRLFFVFLHFDFFSFDILKWILFTHYPGFSFWGSIIGGALGFLLFNRSKSLLIRLSDLYILGFSLGIIFGDFGCHLNGCSVGREASLLWATPYAGFVGRRHPVSLYAFIFDLVLFILVFRILNYLNTKGNWLLSLFYVSLFFITRGVVEFYKENTIYFRGIPVLSLGFIVLGTTFLIIFYKRIGRSFKEDVNAILGKLRRKNA